MSWGHPLWAMGLSLVIALAWAVQAFWRRRACHRQRTVGSGLPHLTPNVGRRRETWRGVLLWSGALALALALGSPRWGSVSVDQHQTGADILLLLDCSRSMLTPDIYPTRMEAARRKAADLLEQAPELRLALMPFAAIPVLRCPFTGDHAALAEMLKDCSPDLFPADQGYQGTAIGSAVSEGLHVLSHGAERGQAILIMSDGADDDQAAVDTGATQAHDAGVPIFGMFFGDSERKATLSVDGQQQSMNPERATLERLAAKTGGLCVSAARDDSDIQALVQRIEKSLKLGPWESHVRVVQSERYQWPLAVGLLLIASGVLLPTRRGARRAAATLPAAARVALLVLSLSTLASAADPWDGLSQAMGDPPERARSEIEALLLEHPSFYAAHYDLGTLLLDKDPAQAIAHLREATVAPDSGLAGDSYLNLSLALLRQGRLDESLMAAASAVQLRPELGDAVNQLRAKIIGIKDEARRSAEEEARKLHITSSSLPPATVGEPYTAQLTAAGGSGGYRFDPLPAPGAPGAPQQGFELEPTGALHGSPDKVGHQEFSITVHDATTAASKTVQLEVLPPPEIVPERLPECIRGEPYHAVLTVHGVTNAIWNVSGLPQGLSLTEIGSGAQASLDGTAVTTGTSTVNVVASDGTRRARRAYQLVVSDSFAPDVLDLPPATAGARYRFRPGIRGPALSYAWSMPQAVDGLDLASDGTVSGIPESEGQISLPVSITASDARSRRFDLTMVVNPPPVIAEPKPISVTAERPVQQPLHVTGGTPPYRWQVTDGTLPQGLRLDADGFLRGATQAVGQAVVTVALQDRWQAPAHQRITITVAAPPPSPDSKNQPDQKQAQDSQAKDQPSKSQPGKDQQPQGQASKDASSSSKPQDQASKDQGDSKPGAGTPGADGQGGAAQGAKDSPSDQGQGSKPDQAAGGQAAAQNSPPPAPAKDNASQAAAPPNHASAQTPTTESPAPGGEMSMQTGAQKGDPARAAAVRWLEALPAENHDALRGQLLRGSRPPLQKGNPW